MVIFPMKYWERGASYLGGVYMDTTLGKNDEQEEFFKELDKGIDDMENGRVLPHEETMKIIGERLRVYVQNTRMKSTYNNQTLD